MINYLFTVYGAALSYLVSYDTKSDIVTSIAYESELAESPLTNAIFDECFEQLKVKLKVVHLYATELCTAAKSVGEDITVEEITEEHLFIAATRYLGDSDSN